MQPKCPQLTTDVLRVWDPDSSPEELLFSSLGNLSTEVGHLEHQDYPGRFVLRLYSAAQIFLQPIAEVYWRSGLKLTSIASFFQGH